ncbi:hypothetical protein [Xylanimonas protaetiae]|uniref:Uncharacterized protein n=1 Tax=Xylanimonas protaetiae TaxID=2509457 RepID=A0A4P6F1S0_9MICO|nr:hypothetical protein [Xylanimonas protaetiae]QAY69750.1 hypothetical protein ET471_06590 [Xylanimonas protaetiae]
MKSPQRTERFAGVPIAELRKLCLQAAEDASYRVVASDEPRALLFRTGRSRWLWTWHGQDVAVHLRPLPGNGSELGVSATMTMGDQVYDWGEGRRAVHGYMDRVVGLVEGLGVARDGRRDDASDEGPVYWATGNYDPERYHRGTRGMSRQYRDYVKDAYGDLDTYESNRPD